MVAVAVVGWLVFRQSISLVQAGFIVLTRIGTTGLYLTTPDDGPDKRDVAAEA